MKTGQISAAVVGLVVGVAVGVWIGAEITSSRGGKEASLAIVQPVEAATPEPAKAAPRRARVSRVSPAASASTEAPKLVMTIPVSAPELHSRMKLVLARGTKIPLAVEGFKDAEQFATVAYAARNTQVPFVLLKHRVLTEGQSLEAAIRASKPELNAATEVERARSEARSDLAALSATD